MKIEQKAQRFFEEFHITHELSLMNWEEFLYRLELEDQDVINQKIEAQLFLEKEAFILQLGPKLSYIWNLTKLTLATEAFFVNLFD